MRRLLLAIAVVLILAAPASADVASPYTQSDPTGDVMRPKGDIRSITITNGPRIKLLVKAGAGTLPSDAVWHGAAGRTFIEWKLFIDPGPSVDWRIRLRSSSSGPIVRVFDAAGNEVACSILIAFLSEARYRLSFDDTCIEAPPAFRARATLAFDPPGTPGQTMDLAPNGAWTPNVARP